MRVEDLDGIRKDLAAALREARAAARLSGRQLATKTHMSQSKISRIERNQIIPNAVDVELILRAINPSVEVSQRISDLAHEATTDYRPDRTQQQGGWEGKQHDMRTLERVCSEMRLFLPAILPGLLQTPEYSKASVSIPVSPGGDMSSVVPIRMQRQRALSEGPCHFRFVSQNARFAGRM